MIIRNNIDDVDRKIMKLRALGYHQSDIAKTLSMTQSAVSQRVNKIRNVALRFKVQNSEKAFWELLFGSEALGFMQTMLQKKDR